MRICKFYRKMEKAILAADCVVSMGGYNTMCEIVGAARPSLIIPRSVPREEQIIRARLFAARGLLEFIPWETVEPGPMLECILKLLRAAPAYEAALASFPMTAFDTIKSASRASETRHEHRKARHGHGPQRVPPYFRDLISNEIPCWRRKG